MKIERLEVVAVDVKDLDKAIRVFSDVLGTTFIKFDEPKIQKTTTEQANRAYEGTKIRIAMDRTGYLELVESTPPVVKEGLRNIHFKVPNLEQTKKEMSAKGIRLVADIKLGSMKAAIYNPDDLHGIRLIFAEYKAPTMVDAILQR